MWKAWSKKKGYSDRNNTLQEHFKYLYTSISIWEPTLSLLESRIAGQDVFISSLSLTHTQRRNERQLSVREILKSYLHPDILKKICTPSTLCKVLSAPTWKRKTSPLQIIWCVIKLHLLLTSVKLLGHTGQAWAFWRRFTGFGSGQSEWEQTVSTSSRRCLMSSRSSSAFHPRWGM